MKALLCCAILFAGAAAFGQTIPGQPPGVTCVANVGVPPTVRSEGVTELVGDLVLQCTGGVPTAARQNEIRAKKHVPTWKMTKEDYHAGSSF